MTQPKTESLLKKINYLEADVEIQKQILFSIPSAQKEELEEIVSRIADKKEEIELLRQELRDHDPKEYDRIIIFEKAVVEFKKIASETPFQTIINRSINEQCTLLLKDGVGVECLVKACDDKNNWTVITVEGEVKQYEALTVAELPPETHE